MEVRLTPEQEAQLIQVASDVGIDAEQLLRDTVLRLIEGSSGAPDASSSSAVAEMRALRARIKPDPEGWTARDYVLSGRR